MRLILPILVGVLVTEPEAVEPASTSTAPEVQGDPDDPLGDLVVEATTAQRHRPRIAVIARADIEPELAFTAKIVQNDLDLFGGFRIVPATSWPADGLDEAGDPVMEPWARAGVEAVVVVGARLENGRLRLEARTWFPTVGSDPAATNRIDGDPDEPRLAAHRTTDAVLDALTGTRGGFASRLVFVVNKGDTRRAWVADPDGHRAMPVTDPAAMVVAADLGPDDEVMYVASVDHRASKLYRVGRPEPIAVEPSGSIYGIDVSPDRSRLALTIATSDGIGLFTGAVSGGEMKAQRGVTLALHPSWSRQGKLAYAMEGKRGKGMRVWVDDKAASPRGVRASSPTVCDHPDGPKLVYVAGTRKRSNLVVTDPSGEGTRVLTHGPGREAHPACSPDGRMVAFVATAARDRPAGIYVVSVDGGKPKRVSASSGDTLRWARLGR